MALATLPAWLAAVTTPAVPNPELRVPVVPKSATVKTLAGGSEEL